jgi:hypothetical protein
MTKEEQRIREFAYDIWVSEGRPDGQDARHWEMARKLVEAENGKPGEKPASRARKTGSKPTEARVVTTPAEADATMKSAARAKVKAATEAEAGTPDAIKKTRSPRATKKKSE